MTNLANNISKLKELARDDPNVGQLVGALVDVIEADKASFEANDPHSQQEHRKSGVLAFWNLVNGLDRHQMISEYYSTKTATHGIGVRDRHDIGTAVRFLMAAGGPQGALSQNSLSRGIGGIFGYIIDILRDSVPIELVSPKKRGSGNRQSGLLPRASKAQLIRILYFKAALEQKRLPDVFDEVAPDRSIEALRRDRNKFLKQAGCDAASKAGKRVRLGQRLTSRQDSIAGRCQYFLDNPNKREELVQIAYREPN